MLIEVFEAEKSRLRWYYLIAYGAPLLVVAISCIIDPLSYGTDRYCWLRADNYFIFSFVGPVILVILVRFARKETRDKSLQINTTMIIFKASMRVRFDETV